MRAAILLAVLAVPARLQAQAPQAPTGSWSAEAAGWQQNKGVLVSDGRGLIYTVGGDQYDSTDNTATPARYQTLRSYDPTTDAWTTLSSAPNVIYESAAAYVDGYIYTFGSNLVGGTYSPGVVVFYGEVGACFRYHIASNSWGKVGDDITLVTHGARACVRNGLIYLVGGGSYGTRYVYRFNPADFSVISCAPMIYGRNSHGVSYVPSRDRIYAMGGGGTSASTMEEYDPVADRWTACANLPSPRTYTSAFSLRSRVYVVGGTGGTSSTLEYNPPIDAWSWRQTMTAPRSNHSSCALRGKGYVHGGGPVYPEEYTPPDFGSPPDPLSGFTLSGSMSSEMSQGDWTGNQVTISAALSDPDAGQLMRLEAQVKNAAVSWTDGSVVSVTTSFAVQGIHSIDYLIPAEGEYDVRVRVADSYFNYWPNAAGAPGWLEFKGNTASPDFKSDQTPPSLPACGAPYPNEELQAPNLYHGPVTFQWTAATDNSPAKGLRYRLQVSMPDDTNFWILQHDVDGIVPTSLTLECTTSRYLQHWRIGVTDIAGNFTGWSSGSFRLNGNDLVDNAAGDAEKWCGTSATGTPSAVGAVFLGILALSIRRRNTRLRGGRCGRSRNSRRSFPKDRSARAE